MANPHTLSSSCNSSKEGGKKMEKKEREQEEGESA
jgi:hypothetical protein